MRFIEWVSADDNPVLIAVDDIEKVWINCNFGLRRCVVNIELRGSERMLVRYFYARKLTYWWAKYRAHRLFKRLLRLLNK